MGRSIPTRQNSKIETRRKRTPNKLYETGFDLTTRIARPRHASNSKMSLMALCAVKKTRSDDDDDDDDDDDSDEEPETALSFPEAEPIPTAKNRTGFYGVTLRNEHAKRPYQVRVRSGDQMLSLGSFVTLDKAARVAAGFYAHRLELHADDPLVMRRLLHKKQLEERINVERAAPIVNKRNTSGYWGVHVRRDRRKGTVFDARFREGARHLYLGNYSTKEEAASVVAGYLEYRKRHPLPNAPAVKRGPRKRRSCVLDDNETASSSEEAPATEARTMTTRANGSRKPATYVSEPSEPSESSSSAPPSPKSTPPPSPKSTPPPSPKSTPPPRTDLSKGGTGTHWTDESDEALRSAVKQQFAEGVAGKYTHGGAMCGRGRPNWTKVARDMGFENLNLAARRCYRRWLAIDPSNKEVYDRQREQSKVRYLKQKAKILLDGKRRRLGPKSGVVGLEDLFTEEATENDHEIPVTDLADLTEFDLDNFDYLADIPDEFGMIDTLLDDVSDASSNNDLYCTDETVSDIDTKDENRGSVTFQTVPHVSRASYKSVVGTPLAMQYTFQPSNLGARYKFEQTRLAQRLAELARKDVAGAKRLTPSPQPHVESTATPAPAPTLTQSPDWRRIERLLRHPVSHEKVALSAPPPRPTASLVPPLTQEKMDSYVKISKCLEGMESSAKLPERGRSDAQRVLHPDFELPQFLLMGV